MWQNLRGRKLKGLKFTRQHPFDTYILNFYCHEEKLCIEADGGIHDEEEMKEYDANRTRTLNENSIIVLQVSNDDIILKTEMVLNKIIDWLNKIK